MDFPDQKSLSRMMLGEEVKSIKNTRSRHLSVYLFLKNIHLKFVCTHFRFFPLLLETNFECGIFPKNLIRNDSNKQNFDRKMEGIQKQIHNNFLR